MTQRCVLDWQVMEERGRAAGLILPSPCLHAARCPSPSENPRNRNDDGQPSIPSKAMVPPESPKSFSCRKVSCHTPPPVALLSPIVWLSLSSSNCCLKKLQVLNLAVFVYKEARRAKGAWQQVLLSFCVCGLKWCKINSSQVLTVIMQGIPMTHSLVPSLATSEMSRN